MNLADMQHDFRRWLTAAAPDAARRLGGEGDNAGEEAGEVAPGLAVYQNNYRAQLVSCLRESYPQLRAHIGEERFLFAAAAHIKRRPPHAWTLDAYADGFAATLAELFPDNPDIDELAWIELALSDAFVAPDAAPLAADALAAADWEHVRLRFAPSLRLAPLSTNADDIWWALRDGQPAPEAAMRAEPQGMAVWRRGYVSSLRALAPLDFAALSQASGQGSFSALCGMLIAELGEAEGVAKAGALLADWIGSELITGLEHGAGTDFE
jgi:hypothetical protein